MNLQRIGRILMVLMILFVFLFFLMIAIWIHIPLVGFRRF